MSARELRTLIRDEIIRYLHLKGGQVLTRALHMYFWSWRGLDSQGRETFALLYAQVFKRLLNSGVIRYQPGAPGVFAPAKCFIRLR
jgi:hypothetical protein